MKQIRNEKSTGGLPVLDVLMLFISVGSIVNIISLALGLFYPIYCLLVSAIILALGMLIFKQKIAFKDSRFSLWLIPILLITLFLRYKPNLYLTGGQDQGTYVSMSKQYEESHGLYFQDDLRESLSKDAKYYYDIGDVFLGVKPYDLEKSEYYMPFYPVFPSWMATFSNLFGSDNRVYVLTVFSILSIIGIYLLAYEVSNRNKWVGLISAVFMGVNPLHVYFSRIPLAEVTYLAFLMFFLYFLVRFYNEYKENKIDKVSLVLSLISANALFYSRMNAIFFLPIIISLPIVSGLFAKDKKLTKILVWYSVIWLLTFLLSFVYYHNYIPYLYNLIVGKRLLSYFDNSYSVLILGGGILLVIAFFLIRKTKLIIKKIIHFLFQKIGWIALTIFVFFISYELYFYIKEIFVDNNNTLLSFNSLSYLKQLSFLATFVYLSPIGFILLPFSFVKLNKKYGVVVSLVLVELIILIIYCWGVVRLIPYHYYYVRYQLSELIPLCTILIAMFFVYFPKSRLGKIFLGLSLLGVYVFSGYFSLLQVSSYEGADKNQYEKIRSTVTDGGILFVAKNEYTSFNQTVFPMKFYYGMKIFPLYYLSYIHKEEIIKEKDKYGNAYLLTTIAGLNRAYPGEFQYIKEIDFSHNYLVHCNRDGDAFFEMEGHIPDIPFCEYIIIPNRYYFGEFKAYLYRWE